MPCMYCTVNKRISTTGQCASYCSCAKAECGSNPNGCRGGACGMCTGVYRRDKINKVGGPARTFFQ